MEIKNVVVAGGGVLGSQIALQSAYKGFNATMWLRSEGSIDRARPKLERLRGIYKQTLEAMKTDPVAYCRGLADSPDTPPEQIDRLIAKVDEAFNSITLVTSEQEAFSDADLVIEAIAEVISVIDCREWQGTMGRVISALNYYGIDHSDIIVYTEGHEATLPKCCIMMEKMGLFCHYLVHYDGKFYDSNLGIISEYDMGKLLGYLEVKVD